MVKDVERWKCNSRKEEYTESNLLKSSCWRLVKVDDEAIPTVDGGGWSERKREMTTDQSFTSPVSSSCEENVLRTCFTYANLWVHNQGFAKGGNRCAKVVFGISIRCIHLLI